VETLTFQSNRKNGRLEEPKFERDCRESRGSFSSREKSPEGLSRVGPRGLTASVESTPRHKASRREEGLVRVFQTLEFFETLQSTYGVERSTPWGSP
jgi:hypothetical protein